MAFFDNALLLSNAQTIGAVTTFLASTSIYDVSGAGSGTAVNQVFGQSTSFGADVMVGRPMYIYAVVSTAFSTGGATLTFSVQTAPGSANTPTVWTTIFSSGVFAGTALTANAQFVAPIPPVNLIKAAEVLPRFYRFIYTVGTASFTAGAVTSGILLDAPTGMVSTLYPVNFPSGL